MEDNNKEMKCSPKCMFFPDMSCQHWVFDDEIPYVKRRKDNKVFKCIYDGHIITSWYDACPKKLEESSKEIKELNYD